MDKAYHLRGWSISFRPEDSYCPPECCRKCLYGYRDNSGHHVITSYIVEAIGKVVTTENGSTYILEDPDPKWVEFLTDSGYAFNPDNPINGTKKAT